MQDHIKPKDTRAADETLPAYAYIIFEFFDCQNEADSTHVKAACGRAGWTQTECSLIVAQPPLGPLPLSTAARHWNKQLGDQTIGTRVGASKPLAPELVPAKQMPVLWLL
jgi:hypothetical protein